MYMQIRQSSGILTYRVSVCTLKAGDMDNIQRKNCLRVGFEFYLILLAGVISGL